MKYLNTTRKIPVILFVALTLIVGGLSGCAGGDMATVTINIGNQFAKAETPSVIDRIIAFLSLSSSLQADPPSGQLGVYSLDLTISGAGMTTITRSIPLETGLITIDVPSGPARLFTVVGYNFSGERHMGGIATKDLSPGDSITLLIEIRSLPYPPENYSADNGEPSGVSLEWWYSEGEPVGLNGFKIYRANNTGDGPGTYYIISSGNRSYYGEGMYYFTDLTGILGDPATEATYYKISAINQYGESEPTEGFSNNW